MIDKIEVVTIDKPQGSGFLAYTCSGESVFIIAEPVCKAGLTIGDKMIAVLVPHRYRPQVMWFADWAVAYGDVTMETVQAARDDLEEEGGAFTAEEIGIHEGDLLYRAGIATKYITLHKKKSIDSYKDISYSVYPETVGVCELEDEEE